MGRREVPAAPQGSGQDLPTLGLDAKQAQWRGQLCLFPRDGMCTSTGFMPRHRVGLVLLLGGAEPAALSPLVMRIACCLRRCV